MKEIAYIDFFRACPIVITSFWNYFFSILLRVFYNLKFFKNQTLILLMSKTKLTYDLASYIKSFFYNDIFLIKLSGTLIFSVFMKNFGLLQNYSMRNFLIYIISDWKFEKAIYIYLIHITQFIFSFFLYYIVVGIFFLNIVSKKF